MSGGDMTRWNRAGLSRFQYIDGNAAHWLEILRSELNARFGNWKAIQDAVSGENKDDAEVLADLLTQYQGPRSDMLWEMVRAFSRSSHILSETMNAYANEGYLRTATQWDNVRRMVEMLDYHPAPPASAETALVLVVKDGESGTVEAAFQVKYSPPDGGPEVIFETLEEVAVDSALNALQLRGWDRSAAVLNADGVTDDDPDTWLVVDNADDFSVGQVAVLDKGDGTEACVVELSEIDSTSGRIAFVAKIDQSNWVGWMLADVSLWLNPQQIHKVLLNGERVVRFDVEHGLTVGDVMAWEDGGWKFNQICEVDEKSVRLAFATPLPTTDQDVYKAGEIEIPDDKLISINPADRRMVYLDASALTDISYTEEETADSDLYLYSITTATSVVYVAPDIAGDPGALAVGIVQDISDQAYEFLGGPGDISSGQWVAAQADDDSWLPLRVANVSEMEDRFLLKFNGCTPADTLLERLYLTFKSEIKGQGFQDNRRQLEGEELTTFMVDTTPSSEFLTVGRTLMIEQQTADTYEHAVRATVSAVDENSISISPSLDEDAGFTLGNTVIRANVIAAGHGKAQSERVLGSGDATQSNQMFLFENEGVSFVADASMSSGVGAAIDVSVDGRIWQQVSTLNNSATADAHYVVRMSEEGFLNISFGDGGHGRRLPSGNNNVRIGWRKGGGLDGNLAAGNLQKSVKPHRLLSDIRQPIASAGGSDMESADALRDNAPASVLALERAVSLADFRHLAASHSSVWQASATMLPSGVSRYRKIEVAIVPSGGGRLSADVQTTLQDYLEQHAVPGCRVSVIEFERIPLLLEVDIQIISDAFDPQAVSDEVRASLLDALALQNVVLGQPLYLSRVYALVESVIGVENADCRIVPGITVIRGDDNILGDAGVGVNSLDVILRVDASPRQLIYLQEGASGLSLQAGEYVL
ncbi:MAG: baseplate J/gp47 family protein [Mariprofundaceae bacterium]